MLTKFEPSLFTGFKAMVGLYPPGTVVRLESGRLAVSFATNPHTPELPQVVVVARSDDGQMEEQETVNLASPAVTDRVAGLVDAAQQGVNPLDYI